MNKINQSLINQFQSHSIIHFDDCVLVYYNKLGAIKQATGLNNKATTEKLNIFDRIDNTLIR